MNDESIPRDDRADSFRQIGDLTALIAELHCRVPVDQLTRQRWQEGLALLREVDTIADDTSTTSDQVVELLESFEMFATTYPALAPGAIAVDNRRSLINRVKEILKVGKDLSATTDIDEFIALRITEGELTSWQLADLAEPETRQNPHFDTKFMPVMASLAITACLWDTISDAKRDEREGKMSIHPDRTFYTKLATESLHHSKEGFSALAHPAIIRHFAVMSITRLRNRIRYGVTPYSSFQNIRYRTKGS